MDKPSFRDDRSAQRYEAVVEGRVVGHADYRLQDDTLRFTHTEVLPQHQGRGLASQLVKFALDGLRARGLQGVPLCAFVAAFVRRHREYVELVPDANRRELGV